MLGYPVSVPQAGLVRDTSRIYHDPDTSNSGTDCFG